MSIKLSWDEILTFVENAGSHVDFAPDVVMGLMKGGVIPGLLMSKFLDCKFDIISIFDSPWLMFTKLIGYKNILFMDDINDSGETMSSIVDMMKNQPFEFGVGALIRRKSSIYHYGTYGVIVDHDDWFDFPWETFDRVDPTTYVEL